MGTYLGALFVAIIGVIVFFERRRLAEVQALVLGGSVLPGCVVFEAAMLLLIACAIAVVHWLQLV